MPPNDLPRVVMIDDHEHMRRLVQMWIDDDGRLAWAGEANDGEEGLQAVASVEPDAVLLDVEMPGMRGIDVLVHLREERPSLVIVLYTSDPSVREEGVEHGADAVFVKGDPIATILDRIVELTTVA